MTRLLTLSDTHGRPWPTVPADVDAVLFGGDLIDGASADEDAPPGDDPLALAWRRRIAGLPAALPFDRVLAVRGNHDRYDPARFFADADDLSTGRLRRIAEGILVGGIGWHGGKYFDLPRESDLRPQCDALRRGVLRQMMPGERFVLLTHYPPALPPLATVAKAGCYYECIAELIRDLRPIAVIAGHMHEWAGTITRLALDDGDALLVMPGPAGICVEVDEAGVRSVNA